MYAANIHDEVKWSSYIIPEKNRYRVIHLREAVICAVAAIMVELSIIRVFREY